MNRHQKQPHRMVRNPTYRQAFQCLDEALDKNTTCSHAEMLKLLYETMFGEEYKPEKSGATINPK